MRNRKQETMTTPSNTLLSVVEKMHLREAKGIVTYDRSMDRTDLSRLQWLIHAQEEAVDLALYLEKLIQQERDTSQ
jgi:hypothetical protein